MTAVARPLVDPAAVLTADEPARACHEAGVRHRTAPAMVEAVLARRPRTKGAAILRGDVKPRAMLAELRALPPTSARPS